MGDINTGVGLILGKRYTQTWENEYKKNSAAELFGGRVYETLGSEV